MFIKLTKYFRVFTGQGAVLPRRDNLCQCSHPGTVVQPHSKMARMSHIIYQGSAANVQLAPKNDDCIYSLA